MRGMILCCAPCGHPLQDHDLFGRCETIWDQAGTLMMCTCEWDHSWGTVVKPVDEVDR
jgi:hypothetical protein